jgi:hypothetical protein
MSVLTPRPARSGSEDHSRPSLELVLIRWLWYHIYMLAATTVHKFGCVPSRCRIVNTVHLIHNRFLLTLIAVSTTVHAGGDSFRSLFESIC